MKPERLLSEHPHIIYPEEEKRLAQLLVAAQMMLKGEWIEYVVTSYPVGLKVDGSMPWSKRGLEVTWEHVNRYYRRGRNVARPVIDKL